MYIIATQVKRTGFSMLAAQDPEEQLGCELQRLSCCADDVAHRNGDQSGKHRASRASPAFNSVITLNVGGKIFACRRSTLQHFPDSIFAKLVSDEWVEGTTRDPQGNIFLDIEPDIFASLLQFFREFEMSEGLHDVALPSVPRHKKRYYDRLLRYLNLEDLLVPRDVDDCFDTGCLDLLLTGLQPELSSASGLEYKADGSRLTLFWAPQEDDPEVEVVLLGSAIWGAKKLRYQLCAMFSETETDPHVAEQKPFLRQFRVGLASKGSALAALQQHAQAAASQQQEQHKSLHPHRAGIRHPDAGPARTSLPPQQQQQQGLAGGPPAPAPAAHGQQRQHQHQLLRQVQLMGPWRHEQQHAPGLRRRQSHHGDVPLAGGASSHCPQQPVAVAPSLPDCVWHQFPEQGRWLCRQQPVGLNIDCKERDVMAVEQANGQSAEVVRTMELPAQHDWCLYTSFRLPKIPTIAWNHGLAQTETKLLRFSVTFDLVKVRLLD